MEGAVTDRLRHLAYTGGWKKCEPVWDLLIRARRLSLGLPLLERVLGGRRTPSAGTASAPDANAVDGALDS